MLLINSCVLLLVIIIKTIKFLSGYYANPQLKYMMVEKGLLSIVELPNKFQGILFGYEINIVYYHKNMICATTLGRYQQLMRLQLVIEYFGPNI